VPICANCGQDNPDPARFCLACGTPLAATAPSVEERKLITVLFTDSVGSTAKAEQMDPEDVRARLAPYYTRLRSELEAFGGVTGNPSPILKARQKVACSSGTMAHSLELDGHGGPGDDGRHPVRATFYLL
jgi:class 3 adenylate cyclase